MFFWPVTKNLSLLINMLETVSTQPAKLKYNI